MNKKLFLATTLLFAITGGVSKAAPAMLEARGNYMAANDTIIDNALVDEHAMYPGGEAALLKFITKNIVFPKTAAKKEIQGKLILKFEVQSNGTVGKIVIDQSLSPECDQAAVDVVRKLKRFIPAKKNGRPVPVWFTLPVNFQIEESYAESILAYRNQKYVLDNSFEVSLHYELCEGQAMSSIASLPIYPDGGLSKLTAELKSEINRPEGIIIGQAEIWVLISETGKLNQISVEKSISETFDNELTKYLLQKTKEFRPAKDINGQAVPVWLRLNVSYVKKQSSTIL